MDTTPVTTSPELPDLYRLPYPPEREPDERAANFDSLAKPGHVHHLIQHFGSPGSTLVRADLYVTTWPERPLPSGATRRVPDLMIAFDVDPAAYVERNGYIIAEQGKPPDFVLEVASASTASDDTGPKRSDYEALGIAEYWRFDETGEHHGERLAGDRLVDGSYASVKVRELPGGGLEGMSEALGLLLRWEEGELRWHDPGTGRHIETFDSQRARADRAKARAQAERARAERAEARGRELEAEVRRLRGG